MRYLPLTDADRRRMLADIGVGSIEDLFRDVPATARLTAPVALPSHLDEIAVEQRFRALAGKNLSPSAVPSFLGGGAYRHHVPATVDYLVQRGEFLTSYTPYQPEVAQGTLQALFEFQTQVALLTAMEVANASMYDGATACAEAALMAARATKRRRILVSGGLHPHYAEAIATYGRFANLDVVRLPPAWTAGENLIEGLDGTTAGVVVQSPDMFGHLHDFAPLSEAGHREGALLVAVFTEAVSLGLLTPPGEMGADIVAGEGQSLGNPLSFGGPMVGLFAAREAFLRQMPGRLAGQTRDVDGRRGFVLTLSTREQHIRREKATSNICTNAGLCALAFSIHLALLGDVGLRRLAEVNHASALTTADRLAGIAGVEVINNTFFNEFTVKLPRPAAEVVERMAEAGVLGGIPVSRFYPQRSDLRPLLLVAATELTTADDIDALADALTRALR